MSFQETLLMEGTNPKVVFFLVYHHVLFIDHHANFAANTSPMPFVSNMGIQITQDLKRIS